jgi:conjugal transfer ATP-binding protein TraC
MLNSFFVNIYGDEIERTIPSKFILSLTVFMDDHEKLKKEVHEKAQWDMFNAKKIVSIAKFFPEIVERTIESDLVNRSIARGETPRRAMFSAIIIDNSVESVEKYGQALKRKFENKSWILQEETLIPHAIFLYSLPLQFEESIMTKYLKRMNTLFNRNCASITPVVTGENGFGDPVLIYLDRAAGLVPVDLFSGEANKNFAIVGASGSGKSYFTSNLVEAYLSSGTIVRVIDVGGSYKTLCNRLGGQYIEFSPESDICLNFFTNIRTYSDGSIDKTELKLIVPLIGLMAMQVITMEDANGSLQVPVLAGYVSEAVNTAFEKRNRGAGMQDVLLALKSKSSDIYAETGHENQLLSDLIVSLYPFADPEGEYFSLFNGSGNLKFENDFSVIELQDLSNDERLRSVVLSAVSYQIGEEFFFNSDLEKRKMLITEEIDVYTKEKAVLSFIEGVGRRIRKHNGALGVVTQFLESFFENSSMKAIFNSCPTKILLKQASGSVAGLVNKGELSFDPSIVTLLDTLKFNPPLYAEFMITRDNGSFFIGRLVTTRKQHWINTQDEIDLKILSNLKRDYGVSIYDARLIQGSAEEEGISSEEEYKKRLKEGTLSFELVNEDSKEEKDIMKEFSNI